MFDVGEELEYLGEERGKYIAIVTKSNHRHTTCHFTTRSSGRIHGEYSFANFKYERKGPPPTKEERVIAKCKSLTKRFKDKQTKSRKIAPISFPKEIK